MVAHRLSLDVAAGEERYSVHPVEEVTPEDVFEHRWAVTVLDRAMARLEEESRGMGTEDQYRYLKPHLTGAEPGLPYREVAANLGMSEGAVKVAVHRLRKRFGQTLRLEIAQTVVEPDQVDDEVRHLLRIIRG